MHDEVISFRNKYIHTYINPKNQSGDRAITQYYTVHHPHTWSNCKYNQPALLKLSMRDKQDDIVIVNKK